ncbi:sulfurtransferase complex subunit TusD [Pantoea sp. Nvir]|uniref:sulfurtransferase complex subunit TusD n=1 Tax=Pantoea sp. Nvir TaxID=2576760 RepID=UPI00135C203C|nr:sulfurtransferase complex subunit TusD [Pantoea sp. Nvir]MXP66920.1 sulfurtransferase complex subunit TusD [Pantoea sp. Nvir]CAJ0992383.1 Sulfurtransferase TusD [Pantoea sp. Nvir]
MRYILLVTGPAYGTQQASSALLFARGLFIVGHHLQSVFFYRDGVLNANAMTIPACDETDIVRSWQTLHQEQGVSLNICIAAAMRRGITDVHEADRLGLVGGNLQPGFELSSLGALAEAVLYCDRLVQF